MSNDHAALYEIVRQGLAEYGEDYVAYHIRGCHNGRLDGRLVTNENLHLFRVYRNSVSSAPQHLIDAAKEATA